MIFMCSRRALPKAETVRELSSSFIRSLSFFFIILYNIYQSIRSFIHSFTHSYFYSDLDFDSIDPMAGRNGKFNSIDKEEITQSKSYILKIHLQIKLSSQSVRHSGECLNVGLWGVPKREGPFLYCVKRNSGNDR